MTAAALATRVATRDVCSWSTACDTLLLFLLAVALVIVTGSIVYLELNGTLVMESFQVVFLRRLWKGTWKFETSISLSF
jgi:hypothetical protein